MLVLLKVTLHVVCHSHETLPVKQISTEMHNSKINKNLKHISWEFNFNSNLVESEIWKTI